MPNSLQQAPAADAQDHLLLQPHLRAASVELAGDASIGRAVHQVVGVEQVQLDPSGADLPSAQVHAAPGELQGDGDPLAVGVAEGHDGELAGIVEGKELDLLAAWVQRLPEVALLPEQADSDERHAQIAGRLEEVARQDAETAAVDGEGLAQAELHAEVGDGAEGGRRQSRAATQRTDDARRNRRGVRARRATRPVLAWRRRRAAQSGCLRIGPFEPGLSLECLASRASGGGRAASGTRDRRPPPPVWSERWSGGCARDCE